MKRFMVLLVLVGASVCAVGQTCTAFPCVVASMTLKNQTQGFSPTPIFIPPNEGLFRVSVYMSGSVSKLLNPSWVVFLAWNDDLGLKQAQTVVGSSQNSSGSSTYVLQAVAGQPILVHALPLNGAGGKGGIIYNLFIVVEQLE